MKVLKLQLIFTWLLIPIYSTFKGIYDKQSDYKNWLVSKLNEIKYECKFF
jgi:hypothetical protein